MKRWNRILAAMLAATMLYAAPVTPVLADEEIVLDDGGVILPAQGAEEEGLEIDPEALPELMPEEIGLDLDDDVALTGNLDLVGDGGENSMPGEEEQAGTEANDSSDFVIRNGVLVEYVGKGGDVVIPDGVTSIGNMAFYECDSLTSVTIPGSVLRINDARAKYYTQAGAFFGCSKLAKVIMKKGITHIGKLAFSDCVSLKSVTIPNSVITIEDWSFRNCTSLTSVIIPYGVTSIGWNAFGDCKKLRTISIPDSVTDICSWAFGNCTGLTEVTIPASVHYIGQSAFEECTGLTSAIILSKKINFNNGVSPELTFKNCPITLHIVRGSDVIDWAKENGYQYDIYEDISDDTLTLKPGQTHKLTVYGYKNSQVTWSSSNRKVATVSGGKAKAVGAGKCVISAKIKNGKTLTCKVTVTDPAKLSKTKLTISAVDSATIKLTGAFGKKVTWISSKSGVARIAKSDSGSVTVKGVKPGTAVIQAKIAGGKTLKCTVKVVAPIEMTMVKIVNESGKRILYTQLANRSGKKITYIKFDILQYDSRNQRLASPYGKEGFIFNQTINAHDSTTKRIDVNGQTDHVKYKIEQVRFSDGTTWKP